MIVYTFSEARQKFASLLEQARRDGAVRIKRRDGQMFLVQPEQSRRSPLDVDGIDAHFTADEIVGIIRDMRRRSARGSRPAPRQPKRSRGASARRSPTGSGLKR